MKAGANAGTLTPAENWNLPLGGPLLDDGGTRTPLRMRNSHVPAGDRAPGIPGRLRLRHLAAINHVDPFLLGVIALWATFYATIRLLAHTFDPEGRHAAEHSNKSSIVCYGRSEVAA